MRETTMETKHGWNVLDHEAALLYREYKFDGGLATTVVFRGKDDGLIVISPGGGVDVAGLDELKEYGRVVALVANNNFHWLGQPSWRKHFPEAKSYAPLAAISRLSKKAQLTFEPLANAAALMAETTTLAEPTGLAGNAFAVVRAKSGTYWYASDILANIPQLPRGFVFKTLMSMTDSAPGYKLFRPAVWLQVKDKKGLASWFDSALTETPPMTVIPGHGAPVQMPDLVEATRALVAKL
jgi:hypothetical protein